MDTELRERVGTMLGAAKAELSEAQQLEAVESVRLRFLGKRGELSKLLGALGKAAPEERKKLGEVLHAARSTLEAELDSSRTRIENALLDAELRGPRIDVTLPGRSTMVGHRHPISRTLEDIIGIFARLGFETIDGPEIETDENNFSALNFPLDHPARDTQDSFFIDPACVGGDKGVLLRTHTSPGQVRTMRARKPPLRCIMPGRVYRRDSDQTHTPMFTQVEGLAVDTDVTLADLKGTLHAFTVALFGAGTKTRFRPSFFPFTEPSAEVDVSCLFCKQAGCRVCKQTGWLEILGSGMVHPNVFRNVGYDPEHVQGFAFGMGVERVTMLRYGIDDLRTMFENDYRFVHQF